MSLKWPPETCLQLRPAEDQKLVPLCSRQGMSVELSPKTWASGPSLQHPVWPNNRGLHAGGHHCAVRVLLGQLALLTPRNSAKTPNQICQTLMGLGEFSHLPIRVTASKMKWKVEF